MSDTVKLAEWRDGSEAASGGGETCDVAAGRGEDGSNFHAFWKKKIYIYISVLKFLNTVTQGGIEILY